MLKPAAMVPAVLTLVLAGSVLAVAFSAQPAAAPPTPASDAKAKAPAAAPKQPERAEGVHRFGFKEPIAKPEGAIRLVSYNIENLFSDQGQFPENPVNSGPGGDGEGRSSQPIKPKAEVQAVADTIRRLDADILALQEIGSKEDLIAFRDQFLQGLKYDHVSSIDAGDGRGIEQSVLSRFPILSEQNWPNQTLEGVHPERWGRDANPNAGKPIEFTRSPLRVTIDVPTGEGGKSKPLTLFVVHHKSGGPGGYWREAEAAGVAKLANEFQKANPGQPVAILGDFNARPHEGPAQIYRDAGWLDTFAGLDLDQPKWTSHTSGRHIDFILGNQPLRDVVIKDTRFILGTPTRAEGVDWRTTPNPTGWASDHYPVVVDLKPRW